MQTTADDGAHVIVAVREVVPAITMTSAPVLTGTTSGAAMIDEINRVFRTHLFTVGNNRVVYLPYDYLPDDATGLYRTYEKGVDVDFQTHHRTKGGRDRLLALLLRHRILCPSRCLWLSQ